MAAEIDFRTLWYGDVVVNRLGDSMLKRLKRAGAGLRRDIVENFQRTPKAMGTRSRAGLKRNKKGQFLKGSGQLRVTKGQKLYERSKPGETPAIQTGDLRRSIAQETDAANLVTRIGPRATTGGGKSLKYARYLEFGTRKMAARPYMRPAIFRARVPVALILAGKR